jgi:hypothetical protein
MEARISLALACPGINRRGTPRGMGAGNLARAAVRRPEWESAPSGPCLLVVCGFGASYPGQCVVSQNPVRTKPPARRTLRVLVGREILFDRLHSRGRSGILWTMFHIWNAHYRVPLVLLLPVEYDSNSNNGRSLP